MSPPTTIELYTFLSFSIGLNLILGSVIHLFNNPLNNKKFQTWLIVRDILNRFNNSISDWKKLPITLNLKDQSQKIIEDVEDKLLRKGYKVSNKDNSITIE
jgi:hypothetical protein